MIAKSILLFLALVVLPQLYFDWRYLWKKVWWKRVLLWLPTVAMLVYTIILALERDFMPENQNSLFLYLFLLFIWTIPKAGYALCSWLGRCVALWRKRHINYGNLVGLFLVLFLWVIAFYGIFWGTRQLEVREIEYASSDLPESFDGYRIVQFSDAHVSTLQGLSYLRPYFEKVIQTINELQGDIVVFTGDLQNTQPQDLYPAMDLLSTIQAKDGVYTVLGNHDYAAYLDCDKVEEVANLRETCSLEQQLGWTLLKNSHQTIKKGKESIVIAGMENDGEGRFPQLGDIQKTLKGVGEDAFIVMLEHDPTSWQRKILPESRAQLTLSGHTHGGQFKLFGWSPVSLVTHEWLGRYDEGDRTLYVTAGVGALIPFRFGVPGEIVVITLKRK